MYRVNIVTDGSEYPLHEPWDNEGKLQLINPVVTLEMGMNGEFKFQIAPTHPHKDRILPLKSVVSVYDDGVLLFRGRPIGDENDFRRIGEVLCEGELAYFVDSIQRPYTFTGGTAAFISQVIAVHNSQTEPDKHFAVGNVTVADTVPDVIRECGDCRNTRKTLREQLIDRNGGYLRVRVEDGMRYLDYISDYGGINNQVIRYGENMLDFTSMVKPTGIITALIPRGAEIESEDTESDVKVYADITSVNDGRDYIFNQDAVDVYGWIWGAQTFDDVTDPEVLLAKARAYLSECTVLPETLELSAVDMGLIDVDVEKLKLGYWTQVESVPHGISKRFLLSKQEIHLDDPGSDRAVLGKLRTKLTAKTNKEQAAISNRIDRVAASTSREINRKVENATQLITGGKGGYVVLDVRDPDTGEKMHPWRILIMNTPDKETATNVIQINQNGIGFSTTGINGPYANAWTIDGNLVADFITAGTMLADRIRGGILELGGTGLGKDGAITVRDADGNVIGSWDKTGLSVLRGIIQGVSAVFGGADNQDGAIEVRDASGQKIGRWDKDGLKVELGEISGSTIRGSKIIGGTINIGGGTFHVDEDGGVVIESGEISLGPVYICENFINIGGFRITDADLGAIISTDKGRTVRIYSKASNEIANGPAIELVDGEYKTRIGRGGINTHDISLKNLEEEYGSEWGSLSYNIIELWNRLIALENSIN